MIELVLCNWAFITRSASRIVEDYRHIPAEISLVPPRLLVWL